MQTFFVDVWMHFFRERSPSRGMKNESDLKERKKQTNKKTTWMKHLAVKLDVSLTTICL